MDLGRSALAGPDLDRLLAQELATWPVGSAGVIVVGPGAVLGSAGDDGPFPWASVTKVITSLTVLHAAEEQLVSLDDPVGPPGATLRHCLSHASGLERDGDRIMAAPGQRRIYSNRGIELAADYLASRTGRSFVDELQDRVLRPLGLAGSHLAGSPATSASGPVSDLARLGRALLQPQWFSAELVARMSALAFPGLAGVLPGFGSQRPNDWGLGVELRSHKQPHWTSTLNSPATFGHFGQSGSFLWVDPVSRLACVTAGDTAFGPWAVKTWPRLSTMVLEVASGRHGDDLG